MISLPTMFEQEEIQRQLPGEILVYTHKHTKLLIIAELDRIRSE